jgi:predicted dehydrogenase/threonine dehydrogenase-like Zn-dependent dehydrogenase
MKQLIIKKGHILNEDVSIPSLEQGFVLIRVAYSSISSGTELAGVTQSKKSMLERAMEKPEKIGMLIDMLKRKGISSSIKQIMDLNAEGSSSGYSISGIVEESGVVEFKPGDRVAAAGGGYAVHAEYVVVPKNLVVHVPDQVSLMEASVAAIGAIALHGVHRSEVKLGEDSAVIGCGLLGLLTLQILNVAGVRVISSDISEKRLSMASGFGAKHMLNGNSPDFIQQVLNITGGIGVDTVIYTAATHESATLSKAFNICRKKGKLVLVGVSGMELRREDIYAKEIDFLISTSYGPGRYDKSYEEGGIDYPLPYVRWTENRNMTEFLRLIEEKKVDINSMVESIYPFVESAKAFESLQNGTEKPLLVLLEYNKEIGSDQKAVIDVKKPHLSDNKKIQVGLIGAGAFARDVHIPNLAKLNDKFQLRAVSSLNAYQAKVTAEQNNAAYSTADSQQIINDPEIDLVMITTRHDSHGSLVLEALKAGKHVFVEKPLAIKIEEIDAIEKFYATGKDSELPILTVGFNRRFSIYANEIKKHTDTRTNPLFMRYRMNAGFLPPDHWVFNAGGRIIGEGCHLIDLMKYLTGHELISISSQGITPSTDYFSGSDNKSFSLKYKDGSIASIDYFSCGSLEIPKEYLEIHFDRKTIMMTDYQQLKGYGIKIKEIKTAAANKGHFEELVTLSECIKSRDRWPIPLTDLLETSYAALQIDSMDS